MKLIRIILLLLVAGFASTTFAQVPSTAHTSKAFTINVVATAPQTHVPLEKVGIDVAVAPSPSVVGSPITIAVRVTGNGPTPGGKVLFTYKGTQILQGDLVDGVVSCTIPGNAISTTGLYNGIVTYYPDTFSRQFYN